MSAAFQHFQCIGNIFFRKTGQAQLFCCAIIGVIIGTVSLTGLGLTFGNLVLKVVGRGFSALPMHWEYFL